MPTKATDDARVVGMWGSLILRAAIASLFFVAAFGKFQHGIESLNQVVAMFQQTFAETWLPAPLVTLHARVTPFVEALIVVWLVTGYKLRIGWVVTGLFLVTLAFGMLVAGKHDIAASNYNYVLIAVAGLWLSRYDRISVDALLARFKTG